MTEIAMVQENPKNQFKTTIHVYLNNGFEISKEVIEPVLIGNRKEVKNGRLLHYIGFEGGKLKLDDEKFSEQVFT